MKNFYKYTNLLLPQNYLAEEILLGIIFIHPHIFYRITSVIKTEYFYLESHKIIYTYLLIINQKNQLNITEFLYTLADINILYYIGGITKILDLMKQSQIFIIASLNINIYIKEIIKLIQYNYTKRLMIQYGYNIIKLAYIPKLSHHKIYNKASYYLNIAENKIPQNKIKTFQELISQFLLNIKSIDNKYQTNFQYQNNQLLKSGFLELDKLILGLPKGDLIIIAGRPSMGKTSLAINIAYNILQSKQDGIYIFSLEMSNKQILNKFISIASNIPLKYIIINSLNLRQWNNLIKTCYNLINKQIYLDDSPNISIDYIEYTSKLIKKNNNNINLIIIDYLQLIQANISNKINRTQELSYITRKLKLLAQYLHLPIIVLSQLNRNIETRTNKQPILSDLKESGCIEFSIKINLITNINNKIKLNNLIYNSIVTKKIKKIYNIACLYEYNFKTFKSQKIYLSTKYNFLCKIDKRNQILITHNHKYISNHTWKQNYLLLDNSCLNKNILINTSYRYNLIYRYYTQIIKFTNYNKSFDLNTQNYFHFICNNIILHNSIEQDSDIIMMIYEKDNNYYNKKKVLDITLCKNRNGKIGSFKLVFSTETTLFENTNDN
uniref:DNA 5'-3' helicase n=1 Tax=Membranoptera platyphylla TaxID=1204437 RepID=A0A1I9KQJ6_9FLOR|nr:putative replicative DNA helicase [Membranoptera platyphylla]AMJ16890.1 putative replicative DNA helicase [Membranoptera platyphylla]